MNLLILAVILGSLAFGVDLAIEYHDTDAWQEYVAYALLGMAGGLLYRNPE